MNVMTKYLETYFDELDAVEFYREIFPEGSFQTKGVMTQGKYNGIIVRVTDEKRWKKIDPDRKVSKNTKTKIVDGVRYAEYPVVKRFTVTDDLEAIQEAVASDDFCLMSPITYVGKDRNADNARVLYAIVVDLDYVSIEGDRPVGLTSLIERQVVDMDLLPMPSYIASSGTGLHLYYVFENGINLFPNVAKQLQKFKHEVTRKIWNDGIVDIKDVKDIQYEGIYQGFRMVGTKTKNGNEDRVRVFETGDKYTMEELNRYVDKKYQVTEVSYRSKITLADASEKWPEWYQNRIVEKKKGVMKPWCVNRAVYDNWKKRIFEGATVGHRYYCIMVLAIYAQKCSFYDEKKNPHPVTYDELEEDAFGYLDFMENKTDKENNHFTTDDIVKALESFQDKFITYPLGSIEYKSGIHIERNRRNGRKQDEHIKRITLLRDADYPDGEWRNKEGRPKKESIVIDWLLNHPDGKKADCVRETGLDKKTVYKYWPKKEENKKKKLDIQVDYLVRTPDGQDILIEMEPSAESREEARKRRLQAYLKKIKPNQKM